MNIFCKKRWDKSHSGQEMSEVRIGRGDSTDWRCLKKEENLEQKRELSLKLRHRRARFHNFSVHVLLVHSTRIESYIDECLWRQKHGKTAEDSFDNIFLPYMPMVCCRIKFFMFHGTTHLFLGPHF